jgi:uncharacterized membrane protein YebE (DUF533 family)
MKLKLILASLLLAGISYENMAQTATPKIRKKQETQQKRIENGVKTGKLTPEEAAKLEQKQAKIQLDKKAAKADGVVTKEERKNIHHQQKKANHQIAKQKHD